ncbi:MAG: serine/threonine protein kinase [Magnetococcales bacterium]|nr:serine/threonine protein kinase [Magnetococcales bacterium]
MMSGNPEKKPYDALGPETILDAVESVGYQCDGGQLALNSYENRVYQIGIEEDSSLVVKFYRPQRWTDVAILEEHLFSQELADLEITAVPPIADHEGRTLHQFKAFRFALYPKRGGRAPELEDPETLAQLGRFMGRIHQVGQSKRFEHRPTLDIESFGVSSRQFLLESGFIPLEMVSPYRSLTEDLLDRIRAGFERAGKVASIRLHGDCHGGNILWTDSGPHFVDFDDARMGPAIQDLWMCLSGDREERSLQLSHLLSGYLQFAEFNPRELHLIEPLRTLRMMHYAAWVARRWHDPAFPRAFPWFNGPRYWDEHLLSLREQAALMEELPLEWKL